MGLLQNGKWVDQWYDTKNSDGRFMRKDAVFRNWITKDGSPGPSGEGGFEATGERYHLYVSHACPWAHRTLIYRSLKGLEEIIPISVVNWHMKEDGWTFLPGEGVIEDTNLKSKFMHQIYTAAVPDFSGRVTVPVLWDKKNGNIVSNESSEIIRMFNSEFDHLGANPGDYYPTKLRPEIDRLNAQIYDTLNNGVYRSGFATTQAAYEEAVVPLFETLDMMEEILTSQRYLAGPTITEADWRAFTTLVRFDPVYVGHFKCNLRRLVDYPNLWDYTRDLYQQPGIAETVHMDHIKNHYYASHETINPSAVVPLGPVVDFLQPHTRDLV